MALSIVEDTEVDQFEDRKKLLHRFNERIEKKEIEFVTFHQSFGYEDFIEGIKPVLPEEAGGARSGSVQYEIAEGIFKRICEHARESKDFDLGGDSTEVKIDDKLLEDAEFYKMSLGSTVEEEDRIIYDYCIKNECIALGWGDDIDFTGVTNRSEIRAKYEAMNVSLSGDLDFNISAIERLVVWMNKGDFVFVSNGNRKLRAIGIITGDYKYEAVSGIPYTQFRPVKWLYKDMDIPVGKVYYKNFSQQSIYGMWGKEINRDFLTGRIKKPTKGKTPNHVLIIDEINRGNVSNIFGELITLIEDDKREGETNELKTRLPYSKESFSVPSNLYIIGTMNTADRSVEALDTALRRRFSFVEMKPQPWLLRPDKMLWQHWKANWEIDEKPFKEGEDRLLQFLEGKIIDQKKFNVTWDVEWEEGFLESHNPFEKVIEFEGLDCGALLTAINERVELLLDSDHCIGHSYFMSIPSSENPYAELRSIMQNKILPLLQEYFYNDMGKIGLILGKPFFEPMNSDTQDIFAYFDHDYREELAEKQILRLRNLTSVNADGTYEISDKVLVSMVQAIYVNSQEDLVTEDE